MHNKKIDLLANKVTERQLSLSDAIANLNDQDKKDVMRATCFFNASGLRDLEIHKQTLPYLLQTENIGFLLIHNIKSDDAYARQLASDIDKLVCPTSSLKAIKEQNPEFYYYLEMGFNRAIHASYLHFFDFLSVSRRLSAFASEMLDGCIVRNNYTCFKALLDGFEREQKHIQVYEDAFFSIKYALFQSNQNAVQKYVFDLLIAVQKNRFIMEADIKKELYEVLSSLAYEKTLEKVHATLNSSSLIRKISQHSVAQSTNLGGPSL